MGHRSLLLSSLSLSPFSPGLSSSFSLPIRTEGPKEKAVMHFSFEYSLLFQDYV